MRKCSPGWPVSRRGNERAASLSSLWNKQMLKDIVEVRALEDYRLYLRYEDGVEGTVDLETIVSFEDRPVRSMHLSVYVVDE